MWAVFPIMISSFSCPRLLCFVPPDTGGSIHRWWLAGLDNTWCTPWRILPYPGSEFEVQLHIQTCRSGAPRSD